MTELVFSWLNFFKILDWAILKSQNNRCAQASRIVNKITGSQILPISKFRANQFTTLNFLRVDLELSTYRSSIESPVSAPPLMNLKMSFSLVTSVHRNNIKNEWEVQAEGWRSSRVGPEPLTPNRLTALFDSIDMNESTTVECSPVDPVDFTRHAVVLLGVKLLLVDLTISRVFRARPSP